MNKSGRRKETDISKSQFLIFKYISDSIDKYNSHPPLVVLSSVFKKSINGISKQISLLEEKGYIKKVYQGNSTKLKEIIILKDYTSNNTLYELTGLSREEILDFFTEEELEDKLSEKCINNG